MSQILETQNIEKIKQEMGPIKASQILRNTKLQQCIGVYNKGDKYCAIGVLMYHFGYRRLGDMIYDNSYEKAAELVNGISIGRLSAMNDSGKSFDEIADYLEQRGL